MPNLSSLYPEQGKRGARLLDYAGTLIATYPAYEDGWRVTAEPTAHCTMRTATNTPTCSGMARTTPDYDFSTGFCVAERHAIFSAKTKPRSA